MVSMDGRLYVFGHHVYEYQKGLRTLVLFTTGPELEDVIVRKLEKNGIEYLIEHVSEQKMNVFFGDGRCIEVVRSIGKRCLSAYTPEEDFMLGIMLGYDAVKQCERYVELRGAADAAIDKHDLLKAVG